MKAVRSFSHIFAYFLPFLSFLAWLNAVWAIADVSKTSHSGSEGKHLVHHCRDKKGHEIGGKEGDNCLVTHAKLTTVDYQDVVDFYVKEDEDVRVKSIVVKVFNASMEVFDQALDKFLAPRPWWVLKYEQSHLFGEEDYIANKNFTKISMVRFPYGLEQRLRLLSSIQFPPKEVCESTPLALGRLVDNGWASMMALYGYARDGDNAFRSIFYPYITMTNSVNDETIFADNSFCPGEVNKWLCAFLPATNCSLPDQVTSCRCTNKEDCPCLPRATQLFYTNASASGVRLEKDPYNPEEGSIFDKYVTKMKKLYQMHKEEVRPGIFYNAYNESSMETKAGTGWILTLYGMLWRHSASLRSRIAGRLDDLHSVYPRAFSDRSECVAIHIRRGDRIVGRGKEETRDFCRRHKMINGDWSNCQDDKGNKVACIEISDMGCFGVNPFGALGLQDYLDRSWGLLQTRNVFVMTDGGEWLEEEKKNISSSWNLYYIPAPKERFSTKNGLEFFSSLAIARKCHAFVGNFMSGVSMMVHQAMCAQHANTVGVCPPTVDIGQK